MKARTLPVSSVLCSCCTTSSICSLDSVGNLAANRSTTSPRARNSSLTPIGKVSAVRRASSRLDYSGSFAASVGILVKVVRRRAPSRAEQPRRPPAHRVPPGPASCQCGCTLRGREWRWTREPATAGRYSIRRFSVRMSRRSCRRALRSGRSIADRMVSVIAIQRMAVPNTKTISSSVLIVPILGPGGSGGPCADPHRSRLNPHRPRRFLLGNMGRMLYVSYPTANQRKEKHLKWQPITMNCVPTSRNRRTTHLSSSSQQMLPTPAVLCRSWTKLTGWTAPASLAANSSLRNS